MASATASSSSCSSSDSHPDLVVENQKFPSVINLNVGGHLFATQLSTLQQYPESMLAAMFSGRHLVDTDPKGNFFIDRNGQHFGHVLNYLRHHDLPPAHLREAVLQEADYYGLLELASRLRSSPSMFMDHMVRENIRKKLVNYEGCRKDLSSMAFSQAVRQCSSESLVHLVVTKNEAKEFLQYSKQARKHYSLRFQVFPSFLAAFGRHYKHLPSEDITQFTDASMNLVVTCLCHDLCKAGYKCRVKPESVDACSQTRLITNDRDEFLVVVNCYEFTFNWLENEQLL